MNEQEVKIFIENKLKSKYNSLEVGNGIKDQLKNISLIVEETLSIYEELNNYNLEFTESFSLNDLNSFINKSVKEYLLKVENN